MKDRTSDRDRTRLGPTRSRADARAGRNGIALQPPPYGIAMVDDGQLSGRSPEPALQAKGESGSATLARPGDQARLPSDGAGRAMPDHVRAGMESALGADFSAVRIHEGQRAASLGARAYTQGTAIHFAPGAYQPHSQRGRALLGHELAHVVQQAQGRVQASAQACGLPLSHDQGLEREADEIGARVAEPQPAPAGRAMSSGLAGADTGHSISHRIAPRPSPGDATQAPVQGKFGFEIETRMLVTEAPAVDTSSGDAPDPKDHHEPPGTILATLPNNVRLHKDHHERIGSRNSKHKDEPGFNPESFAKGPLVELVTYPALNEANGDEGEVATHMQEMVDFAKAAKDETDNFEKPVRLDSLPRVTVEPRWDPTAQPTEGTDQPTGETAQPPPPMALYVGGLVPGQHIVGYAQATFGVRLTRVLEMFQQMQSPERSVDRVNWIHRKRVTERTQRVMQAVRTWVKRQHGIYQQPDGDQELEHMDRADRELEPGWEEKKAKLKTRTVDANAEKNRRRKRIAFPPPPDGWQTSSRKNKEYVYNEVTGETLGWRDELGDLGELALHQVRYRYKGPGGEENAFREDLLAPVEVKKAKTKKQKPKNELTAVARKAVENTRKYRDVPYPPPPSDWDETEGRVYVYDATNGQVIGWEDELRKSADSQSVHAESEENKASGGEKKKKTPRPKNWGSPHLRTTRPYRRTLQEKLNDLGPLEGLIAMIANYLDLPGGTDKDANLKNAIGQLMPKSELHTVRNAMEGFSRELIEDPEVQQLILMHLMAGGTGKTANDIDMEGTLRTILLGQSDALHRSLMARGGSEPINNQRLGPGGEPGVVVENRNLQPKGGVGKDPQSRKPTAEDIRLQRQWFADHLQPDEWVPTAVDLYHWLRKLNEYEGEE